MVLMFTFATGRRTTHHAAGNHGAEEKIYEPPLQFVDRSGEEHGRLGAAKATTREQVGGSPEVGENG